MYCDLVGSTALGEHFDAEQMHDIVNTYRDTCTEVVNRYGGTVARYSRRHAGLLRLPPGRRA